MPKWFDTLKQQSDAERNLIAAVDSVKEIPENASSESGWSLTLSIMKITPQVTINDKAYYWLLVKDLAGNAFSIVVWGSQWDDLGPFEEGEKRQLTVKIPKGDYTAWNLF